MTMSHYENTRLRKGLVGMSIRFSKENSVDAVATHYNYKIVCGLISDVKNRKEKDESY